MNIDSIIAELGKVVSQADIKPDEPLSRHTSIKIGGPVEALVTPRSKEQLLEVCKTIRAFGREPIIIGNGSNILASDGRIASIAVKTHDGLSQVTFCDDTCFAESGMLLSRLAVNAQKKGLAGLEFVYGIPGTLGGAVFMNAGAYGAEMKDVVVETEVLGAGGQVRRITDHGFSYRRSVFIESGEIILGSKLKLTPDDPAAILDRMNELSARRKASQPLDVPSAGSAFKRPKEGFAAVLIDEAGLKGFSIGGAQVSEKHAGFIINKGGATCDDVLSLIEHIKKTVIRVFGIELEPEIRLIQ
ncbi:MAG: UDP-N-acetylmuramate dehydrogenase [Clostridiales bacterium]|jgi:UDP-N-acetylmuramate dehydrogenase|nr:UDP-N-acetylmuramate dehydrogenase [Clostridiales bacterium]